MDETNLEIPEPSEFDLIALCMSEAFRVFPDCRFAPMIPTLILFNFDRFPYDLREDEVLLAIVRANGEKSPGSWKLIGGRITRVPSPESIRESSRRGCKFMH